MEPGSKLGYNFGEGTKEEKCGVQKDYVGMARNHAFSMFYSMCHSLGQYSCMSFLITVC